MKKQPDTLTDSALRARLLARVIAHGQKAAFAKAVGISPQYLSDILAGKRAIPDKVLHAIGVERVTTYRERSDGK